MIIKSISNFKGVGWYFLYSNSILNFLTQFGIFKQNTGLCERLYIRAGYL